MSSWSQWPWLIYRVFYHSPSSYHLAFIFFLPPLLQYHWNLRRDVKNGLFRAQHSAVTYSQHCVKLGVSVFTAIHWREAQSSICWVLSIVWGGCLERVPEWSRTELKQEAWPGACHHCYVGWMPGQCFGSVARLLFFTWFIVIVTDQILDVELENCGFNIVYLDTRFI